MSHVILFSEEQISPVLYLARTTVFTNSLIVASKPLRCHHCSPPKMKGLDVVEACGKGRSHLYIPEYRQEGKGREKGCMVVVKVGCVKTGIRLWTWHGVFVLASVVLYGSLNPWFREQEDGGLGLPFPCQGPCV